MILETSRLWLRELTPEDLDAVCAWQGNAHTMRFYGRPFSREESRSWIERCIASYKEHGFGLWALLLRDGPERVIGNVGISLQPVDGERLPEIGYQLHQDYWGQGLATEAAIGCRDLGFQQFGFPRLVSWMALNNWPSRRVADRAGMRVWKETVNPKSGTLHVVYSVTYDALD